MMNLFICYTVLQVFIALRIIKVENITQDECEFIIFFGPNSNRNAHYINEAKKISRYVTVMNNYSTVDADKNPNKNAQSITQKISKQKYNAVYLSNIDKTVVCYILQKITFSKLITFDDGASNINTNSMFYNYKSPTIFRRMRNKIFKKRTIFQSDIINLSSLHYTIFKKQKSDLFKNYKLLNVFPYQENTVVKSSDKINIFLGSVYDEVITEKDKISILILQLQKFVQNKKIDIYIPHPRYEVDCVTPYCNYLSPDKLSEEVISEYLIKGYTVKIYGIASSVLLNLCTLNNVEVFNITSELLSYSCNHFHELDPLIIPLDLNDE